MKDLPRKLLLWAALVAVLAVQGTMLHALRQRILDGQADFTAFYSAARVVAEGRGGELYRFRTQLQFQHEFPSRRTPLLFYHPPFELLLFLPLAWLPFVHAYAVWMGVNLALLVYLAYLRHPYSETFLRFRGLLPLVLALAFFPVAWSIVQGQDSVLLLLLFSLAWIAMRRGQSFRAGCFLALGLFKFQFVLPFMVALAVRRNWKALQGFLWTGLGLGLLSLVPVGWQGVRSYVEFLLEINRRLAYGTIHPVVMPNVRGLVTMFVGSYLPAPWPGVIIAVLSLLLLLLVVQRWPRQDETTAEQFDLVFALNLVVTMLVSYHLNPHDLALLFLAVMLVTRHLLATRGERRMGRIALLACAAALYVPTLYLHEGTRNPHPLFWVLGLLATGLVLETGRQIGERPA